MSLLVGMGAQICKKRLVHKDEEEISGRGGVAIFCFLLLFMFGEYLFGWIDVLLTFIIDVCDSNVDNAISSTLP
jgi:hypothetical protein